jgi:hypothetical protein
MAGPETPAHLSFSVASDQYDPSDDRWRSQVQVLLQQLHQDAGPVRQEITPVAGQKGGAAEIILALGTAGAFGAAVTVFQMWLARSRDRVATFVVDGPNGKTTVEIRGDTSEAVIKDVIARSLK